MRQRKSKLMREHTHLPAMVSFVSKHIAQHLHANRPRRSPSIPAKHLDAAPAPAQGFTKHLRAASGALQQSRTGLLRRAVRAVQPRWNLQVRSRKPDPLAADIVHVRKDRRNAADLARRFSFPGVRVKMFDKILVHTIIRGKHLDCDAVELSANLGFTRGHGFLLLDSWYFRIVGSMLLLESWHVMRGLTPRSYGRSRTERWSSKKSTVLGAL
jgi:hypothetical protein